jgi:adenylate cyclase
MARSKRAGEDPEHLLRGDALDTWLFGDPRGKSARYRRRVQRILTISLVVANAVGAIVVACLGLFLIPGPSVFSGPSAITTFVVLPLYVLAAFGIGVGVGTVWALRTLRWFSEARPPTAEEARATFAVPLRLMVLQGTLWAGAVVLCTVLYGLAEPRNVPRALFSTLFGGIVVCANAFLLAEFALRPVAAQALRFRPRSGRRAGVRARTLLVWTTGSAIPVIGVMTLAVFALFRDDISVDKLATTILALGVVMLVFGLLLIELLNRATMAPIRAVRTAMQEITQGRLSAEVAVFDGTELGDLQAGFNDMATGLRERDQVRDLFGRHVGESVAAAALASRPELGGEERYVAVLFVDVAGSTELALAQPPAAVVDLLNRFFTVVVEEVEAHDGLINKFIGDAALAIFGAPTVLPYATDSALAAARAVMDRLAAEVPDIAAGAGVASGCVIAGNVGTRERFEYTVIGDPVNEASRLADLAKETGGIAVSRTVVEQSGLAEQRRWEHDRDVELRGRHEKTEVYRPVSPSGSNGYPRQPAARSQHAAR